MLAGSFDRNKLARWYARKHLKTDPGVREVYYLPGGAPEREIRFIEINDLIADREAVASEPLDFGVDRGGEQGHTLLVLDVAPRQWEKIGKQKLQLPSGWSLEGAVHFQRARNGHE